MMYQHTSCMCAKATTTQQTDGTLWPEAPPAARAACTPDVPSFWIWNLQAHAMDEDHGHRHD
eukprot:8168530-Karenia_brevis.AAC.1